MQQTGAVYQPPMRTLLADFATFDAPMLVTSYLRSVLLFVYANTPSHHKELFVERRLALRLLSRSVQIGNRFSAHFTSELNGKPSSPVRSNNVHRLSRRIQDRTRDEAAALERILRKEKPEFVLPGSAFDAICFAHCLETALQESVELTPADRDIVFRSWIGVFAETVRESYIRYIQVLLNGSELAPQALQDFVDTMPFSIENRGEVQTPRVHPATVPVRPGGGSSPGPGRRFNPA